MSAVLPIHHSQKNGWGAQKWVGGGMHNKESNHGRLGRWENRQETTDNHFLSSSAIISRRHYRNRDYIPGEYATWTPRSSCDRKCRRRSGGAIEFLTLPSGEVLKDAWFVCKVTGLRRTKRPQLFSRAASDPMPTGWSPGPGAGGGGHNGGGVRGRR